MEFLFCWRRNTFLHPDFQTYGSLSWVYLDKVQQEMTRTSSGVVVDGWFKGWAGGGPSTEAALAEPGDIIRAEADLIHQSTETLSDPQAGRQARIWECPPIPSPLPFAHTNLLMNERSSTHTLLHFLSVSSNPMNQTAAMWK